MTIDNDPPSPARHRVNPSPWSVPGAPPALTPPGLSWDSSSMLELWLSPLMLWQHVGDDETSSEKAPAKAILDNCSNRTSIWTNSFHAFRSALSYWLFLSLPSLKPHPHTWTRQMLITPDICPLNPLEGPCLNIWSYKIKGYPSPAPTTVLFKYIRAKCLLWELPWELTSQFYMPQNSTKPSYNFRWGVWVNVLHGYRIPWSTCNDFLLS